MAAKILKTDDIKRVLDQEEGTVYLVDANNRPTHVVLPLEDARRMFDEYLRRELEIGFAQADRGELTEWAPERIKAEGRAILEQRSQRG